jgi:hypothetical protein
MRGNGENVNWRDCCKNGKELVDGPEQKPDIDAHRSMK